MFLSGPLPGVPDPEAAPGTETVPYSEPSPLDQILADKVLQWRCKVFLDLGMTLPQSRRLTLQKSADLNEARGLIKNGCSPTLAFDILAE